MYESLQNDLSQSYGCSGQCDFLLTDIATNISDTLKVETENVITANVLFVFY